MHIDGKRVLVIGLGKTGVETARFLKKKNAEVIVADEKSPNELKDAINALGEIVTKVHLGNYSAYDVLDSIDMVVPSPGVRPSNRMLVEAQKKGIPIISEIELAWRFLKTPIIAVTGTNGKTTTTRLLAEVLQHAGKKVFVGGNIGIPLITHIDEKEKADYAVLEVSSFQLQWVTFFRPFISILLNTMPDHLDYHATLEEYRSIKEKIFANQNRKDLAILNYDDPRSLSLSKEIQAKVHYFSSSAELEKGIFIDGNLLRYRDHSGNEEIYPIDMIKIRGVHNLENIMAVIVASRACGCQPHIINETLKKFTGLPHRIELVGSINGIDFYDDSKGTNVGAVFRALQTFSKPVILLLGGRDKGGNFTILTDLMKEKVKELVLFGEAREKIYTLIGNIVKTKLAMNLKVATEIAYSDSSSGDVILLSPGCSSFDEFKDYADRGVFFKDIVKQKIG